MIKSQEIGVGVDRERRRGSTTRRSAARSSASGSCSPTTASSTSTATRSAGCPGDLARLSACRRRASGGAARARLGRGLDGAAGRDRRPARIGRCSAPRRARSSSATRRPSASTSSRVPRSTPGRDGPRSSPTSTTSRPTATCSRDWRPRAGCDVVWLAWRSVPRDRRADAVAPTCRRADGAGHVLARLLSLGAHRRHGRDLRGRPRCRRADAVGSQPQRRLGARSRSTATAPISPSAARTST